CYHKVIEIDNNNLTAYYNLGVIAWKKQNWEKVIEYFNKVLQLQPDNTLVRNYIHYAIRKKQGL
ncbi:MAG: tetratricopeptide repeat protein, partial [Endomicrobia bacterium]|nr:tetratricopeptide repeat protein [Endomicrobiia bacterium]